MDWNKLASELEAQAAYQGDVGRQEGSTDLQQAAGLAAQQTLHGLANAIRETLQE